MASTPQPQLSQQQLHFGIEIEVAIATHDFHRYRLNPHGKTTRFYNPNPVATQTFSTYQQRSPQVDDAARAHIAASFRAAGLAATDANGEDPSQWIVSRDGTVQGPPIKPELNPREDDPSRPGRGADWIPIEVKSPAMPFTAASLADVRAACRVLNGRYVAETNRSTGLHVHVSAGVGDVLAFRPLRSLLRVLWVFEEQFDTLHPAHRQESTFARSFRLTSRLAEKVYGEHGIFPPSSRQGALSIGACESRLEMLDLFWGWGQRRYVSCNVEPAWDWLKTAERRDKAKGREGERKTKPGFIRGCNSECEGDWEGRNYCEPLYGSESEGNGQEEDEEVSGKPTLEFRAHEGTTDADRICEWISLLVGLVSYCESVKESDLLDLLKYGTDLEKWQMTSSGALNTQLRAKHGPPLAESGFTIIDLLNRIGLHDSANYYTHLLHPVAEKTEMDLLGWYETRRWIWEHQEQMARGKIADADFEIQEARRVSWEAGQSTRLVLRFTSDGYRQGMSDPDTDDGISPKRRYDYP